MSAAWEVRFSNSKQLPYFYNPQTSQSIWEPPANLSPDQLNALPGARQYLGAAPKGKDGEIRASHILVKHVGSRRASSWKQVGSCSPASALRVDTIYTIRVLHRPNNRLLPPRWIWVRKSPPWCGNTQPYVEARLTDYRTRSPAQ